MYSVRRKPTLTIKKRKVRNDPKKQKHSPNFQTCAIAILIFLIVLLWAVSTQNISENAIIMDALVPIINNSLAPTQDNNSPTQRPKPTMESHPISESISIEKLSNDAAKSGPVAKDLLSLADQTTRTLLDHPLKKLNSSYLNSAPLEDIMLYLHKNSACKGKPIFTSMANVGSELYWQM